MTPPAALPPAGSARSRWGRGVRREDREHLGQAQYAAPGAAQDVQGIVEDGCGARGQRHPAVGIGPVAHVDAGPGRDADGAGRRVVDGRVGLAGADDGGVGDEREAVGEAERAEPSATVPSAFATTASTKPRARRASRTSGASGSTTHPASADVAAACRARQHASRSPATPAARRPAAWCRNHHASGAWPAGGGGLACQNRAQARAPCSAPASVTAMPARRQSSAKARRGSTPQWSRVRPASKVTARIADMGSLPITEPSPHRRPDRVRALQTGRGPPGAGPPERGRAPGSPRQPAAGAHLPFHLNEGQGHFPSIPRERNGTVREAHADPTAARVAAALQVRLRPARRRRPRARTRACPRRSGAPLAAAGCRGRPAPARVGGEGRAGGRRDGPGPHDGHDRRHGDVGGDWHARKPGQRGLGPRRGRAPSPSRSAVNARATVDPGPPPACAPRFLTEWRRGRPAPSTRRRT